MKRLAIFAALSLLSPVAVQAQCAMCKATVESNGSLTSGINAGILYMMVIPYLLLAALGFIWYKNYKKFKERNHGQSKA
ncbi:hypothetical protein FHS56_000572 [Thermonema lapsum]|uniref:Uncharacterized protein n=1 Tax=Thermonema lapsum TaxID=28195 RepID=A0A846MNG6_9BACT|nr:hypothetical protein [Thermonema lapsum]NIK73086.1 hypothetical protein [Thermonema lapsum]